MSNVLEFPSNPRDVKAKTFRGLCSGIAETRRSLDDVFWLKENAELLGMLAATNSSVRPDVLAAYQEFYDNIEERLRFYPQYYRFFVSMCLDLEDLGLEGCKGASLCKWAAAVGLADAELSDLQRAEARHLLYRRGEAKPPAFGPLGDRLRHFIERPSTFALPNKKAAYELTHIVFYLSEYGQVDPQLSNLAVTSLEYLGVVAFLDQDHDLLAEVCLALHYARYKPSPIWIEAVSAAHTRIMPMEAPVNAPAADGFHAYLVTGWALAALGRRYFREDMSHRPLYFKDPAHRSSIIRPLSACLLDLGNVRSGDWSGMRGQVIPYLDADSREVLRKAEASTDKFEGFFEEFARASAS